MVMGSVGAEIRIEYGAGDLPLLHVLWYLI